MDKIKVIPFESELELTCPNGNKIKITGELHNRLNAVLASYTQLLGIEGLQEAKRRYEQNKLMENDIHYCYFDLMYMIADLEQLFIDNGLATEREITEEDIHAMTSITDSIDSAVQPEG